MTSMIKAATGALLLVATLAPAETRVEAQRGAASGTQTPAAALRAIVSPHFARAPAIVRIEALVEPADANRTLELVIDSDTYYRQSTIELNGGRAPRVHYVEFRPVPAGTHDVYVMLSASSGTVRAIVHDRVTIYE